MILISTEVLREIRRDIAENLGKPGVARMSDENGLLRQVPSGRTSRAIGARCPSRNNLGGAYESDAIFLDLIFPGLQLLSFHFRLAHQLARRFRSILFPIRRRLLGTRCGDDTRDKEEGGTTNLDARLICSHRRHFGSAEGFSPKY